MIVLKELAELVQACKDVKARMTPDNHKIHVDDIAATLQKIIDDEFARAKRTFDQVVIDEVIAEDNPADPKTFCETVQAKESDQCAEWGQELAQLRAAHIENARKARGTFTCAKCNPGESHPDVDWCDICAAPKPSVSIKVPALPRRRRERSRRADRLKQSPKTDKGSA